MLVLGQGMHEVMKHMKYISQICSLPCTDLSRKGKSDATAYAHTLNLQALTFASSRERGRCSAGTWCFIFGTVSRYGWLRCVQL